MCLLVVQHKSAPVLTDEWLEDFYNYNQDGVGVMYSDGHQLHVHKELPSTAQDFRVFYHEFIKNRACAFHLRMKTHGDINLDNCHPYEILNVAEHGTDLWMMHNGILDTGNAADKSKSDTWHYIESYLKPLLAKNPDFAFSKPFKNLIESHIGKSNKFVLMNSHGAHSVMNKSHGVFWAGMWLSNTYAWTAPWDVSYTKSGNKATWDKQAKEMPELRPSYKVNGFKYDEDEMLELIDLELSDLIYAGYSEIEKLSHEAIYRFTESQGIQAIFDLIGKLYEGMVTDKEFVRTIKSPPIAFADTQYFRNYDY